MTEQDIVIMSSLADAKECSRADKPSFPVQHFIAMFYDPIVKRVNVMSTSTVQSQMVPGRLQ